MVYMHSALLGPTQLWIVSVPVLEMGHPCLPQASDFSVAPSWWKVIFGDRSPVTSFIWGFSWSGVVSQAWPLTNLPSS